MSIESLKEKFFSLDEKENHALVQLGDKFSINIYPDSLNESNRTLFFMGLVNGAKHLYVLGSNESKYIIDRFDGMILDENLYEKDLMIKQCPLNHKNVLELQEIFSFTKPIPIGLVNSFGFGDRLGLANAGHVRALRGYNFKPVFAQQSIRELTRTQRTAEDVLDAAVWAVFQEGYRDGFGADADHLKTTQDIDLMVKANYKTITLDPSEYIFQKVEALSNDEIIDKFNNLPWSELNDSAHGLKGRYERKKIKVGDNFSISPAIEEILKASLKYSRAFVHIKKLSSYLSSNYSDSNYEIEISIDETDTVTTPFEHYFIVNELRRLNVEFVSLAPRFVGDFEKGIDYKGDIKLFKAEYVKHIQILEHFGFYKISFHSGSDKFAVYKAVAQINRGVIHIKTAGTSYLEALKVVAVKEPNLFREILDFSKSLFDSEKATYHVSAKVENVRDAKLYPDSELLKLMSLDDSRQILHVAFGKVLTEKDKNGDYLFRDKILECLKENEELFYDFLIKHFHKHMDPFKILTI
jgi:tagaturonate epimerase